MNRSKAAFFLALLAAVIAGCIMPNRQADPPVPARPAELPGLDVARQLNEAFVAVAGMVSPSVVVLEVTEKPVRGRRGGFSRRSMGEGAGIIVTKDGYILTNNHIVDNADKIQVYLRDGRSYIAQVRGMDPKTDIAVVKINTAGKDLPVAKLGDSDKVQVGEFVVAIGHPMELTYSATYGHISAIARQLPTDSYANISDDQEYIQTDAVINPGNSGGPLINLNGEVIAVNAMMEGYTDPISGITQNRGIGLAIPINEARVVQDRLIKDGKFTRSIIGIKMAQQPRDPLRILALDGVSVAEVTQNGPADKAGLKPNDTIVAVDGMPVKTARDLRNEVSLKKPGQSITVSVKRENSSNPVPIKIITEAEAPPAAEETLVSISPGRPSTAERTSESTFGFTAKALTKELAAQYGVETTEGVIVTDVIPFGRAYQREIEPGDIITKMNNKDISTIEQFKEAVKAVNPGDSLTMELKTKDGTAFKVLRATSQ